MKTRRFTVGRALGLLTFAGVWVHTGCAAIVGINDVQLGEDGGSDGSVQDVSQGSEGSIRADTGPMVGPEGGDAEGGGGSDAAGSDAVASDALARDGSGGTEGGGGGCDASVASDPLNCGSCGHVCGSQNAASPPACNGTCQFHCAAPWAHCSTSSDTNGCDVNTNTDSNSCGGCGNQCTGGKACNGSGTCACIGTASMCGGTTCINLAADSSNCGSCGHVCAGGEACSGGRCQPELLVDSTHGLAGLYHLALQGTNLYGTNYLAILNAGLAWTTTTTPGVGFKYLTPPPNGAVSSSNSTGGLAVDPTYVWFGIQHGPNAGTWKTPIAGPASSTAQVSGFYDVNIFAIDVYAGGPYMYISDGYNSGFAREPKSGVPAAPTCDCFNTGYPPPSDILTDASGNVYWSMGGNAKWVAQASATSVASWITGNGCAASTLVTGITPSGLGLDSTYVYFSDSGANKIKRIPIGGGTVTDLTASVTLPAAPDAPGHLVVDSRNIYWVTGTGNLWAIGKDGTSTNVSLLVTGRKQIGAVTYDANFLYFTDSGDGTVWRVSK
jgi:hypothetical protein